MKQQLKTILALLPLTGMLVACTSPGPSDQADTGGETSQSLPSPSPDPHEEGPSPYDHSVLDSAADCEPFQITELPNGDPAGAPEEEEWQSDSDKEVTTPAWTWGEERNRVTVLFGFEPFDLRGDRYDSAEAFLLEGASEEQIVEFDGELRSILPIGDFGLGMVQIRFVDGACPYALYLPGSEFDGDNELWSGYTLEEARDYALRF